MTSPYDLFKEKQIDLNTPAVLDYGDFTISIKHGGAGNKTFANAAQLQLKQFERRDALLEKGALSDDAIKKLEQDKQDLLISLYADHIVIGWDNVKDKDGNQMEFNKDNIKKLFSDLPALFQDVIQQAMDISNFREQELETDSKN